ncbi:hypothetical protein, partial [Methanogenium cariaci]|uniref:hypothetical protein n=1 Tax=Methanogenium cariaci TaxID=2197 RepID=UPI001C4391D9
MDGFRSVIEFKDLRVTDECLVVHEVMLRHGKELEWGGLIGGVGRAEGESVCSDEFCRIGHNEVMQARVVSPTPPSHCTSHATS